MVKDIHVSNNKREKNINKIKKMNLIRNIWRIKIINTILQYIFYYKQNLKNESD